jgi:hypothetical protein
MLTATPSIHPADAVAYVVNHFATHDYGTPAHVTGFDCAVDGVVEVRFVGAGSAHPASFHVWNEARADGTFYAYGEW